MRFETTTLAGVILVHLEGRRDERGSFTRTFDAEEFRRHGMIGDVVQGNLARSKARGTLRGLHYQIPPAEEAKFVRCTSGAIHDVIVDMRRDSQTFLRHYAVELRADADVCLYVPPMFAHGYQALTDNVEVTYHASAPYTPELERGVRFDDPRLGIAWPLPVTVVSEKDRSHALLDPPSDANH